MKLFKWLVLLTESCHIMSTLNFCSKIIIKGGLLIETFRQSFRKAVPYSVTTVSEVTDIDTLTVSHEPEKDPNAKPKKIKLSLKNVIDSTELRDIYFDFLKREWAVMKKKKKKFRN